jgi:hypothetical protein
MSWSARLASERSTSQAIYATRDKSRGCAPLPACLSVIPSGARSAEHLILSMAVNTSEHTRMTMNGGRNGSQTIA